MYPRLINRRNFLKGSAAGMSTLALSQFLSGCAPVSSTPTLNVLVPAAPDPAPPGVAKFSEEAFAKWKADNKVEVRYEAPPWPQLHDKMAANFASGQYVHDVVYMSGWVPEFAESLVPFVDQLPADLVADLPKSSFSTVTWNGQRLGAVFTLCQRDWGTGGKGGADVGIGSAAGSATSSTVGWATTASGDWPCRDPRAVALSL